MLELESVVVLVSLRSEAYFLHLNLHLLLLYLFLMFLLLVKELRIVDDATNWRFGIRGNLYEVYSLLACHVQRFANGHYHSTILTDYAYLLSANLFIHAVLKLHLV